MEIMLLHLFFALGILNMASTQKYGFIGNDGNCICNSPSSPSSWFWSAMPSSAAQGINSSVSGSHSMPASSNSLPMSGNYSMSASPSGSMSMSVSPSHNVSQSMSMSHAASSGSHSASPAVSSGSLAASYGSLAASSGSPSVSSGSPSVSSGSPSASSGSPSVSYTASSESPSASPSASSGSMSVSQSVSPSGSMSNSQSASSSGSMLMSQSPSSSGSMSISQSHSPSGSMSNSQSASPSGSMLMSQSHSPSEYMSMSVLPSQNMSMSHAASSGRHSMSPAVSSGSHSMSPPAPSGSHSMPASQCICGGASSPPPPMHSMYASSHQLSHSMLMSAPPIHMMSAPPSHMMSAPPSHMMSAPPSHIMSSLPHSSMKIHPSSVQKGAPSSSAALPPFITPDNYTVINRESGFQIREIIQLGLRYNIAISKVAISSGVIEVKDSGSWSGIGVTSLKESIIRPKNSYIRFVHSRGQEDFYGVVVIDFTLTEKESGGINTESAGKQKKLYILVPPKTFIPAFNSSADLMFTIKEDSKCQPIQLSNSSSENPKGLMVKPFKFDDSKFTQYRHDINASVFMSFQDGPAFMKFRSYVPGYWIKSISRGNGRWYFAPNPSKKKSIGDLTKRVLPYAESAVCFEPALDYFGEVKIVIVAGFVSKGVPLFGTGEVTVTIKVNATNDRPVVVISELELPSLPYNMSGYATTGFTVASLLTKAVRGKQQSAILDKDGDTVGIGLVSAFDTKYGTWEYKCSGGSWTALNLSYTGLLKDVASLSMVLLTPNDYIRFKVTNDTLFWPKRMAPRFQAVAWDQTDSQTCGAFQYVNNGNVTWPVSFSTRSSFATGAPMRKDCSGKPGDKKVDSCNICGGDGTSCVGCDGVANSGALFDFCGTCTGGTSGNTFNAAVDCGKTCGDYFTDDCGVCNLKAKPASFKDCAGVCFGNATINKCGSCVLGNTSKLLTDGEDDCGVCGGDNSTCLDCAGVPNGGKVIDLCKSCKLLTDQTFNTGCVELGSFNPVLLYSSQLSGATIVIEKSGTISSVACSFINSTDTITSSATLGNKKITANVPHLKHGTYTVNCTINGATLKSATSTFTVIDPSAVTISSLSSTTVLKGENATIVVTGTGFLDTGSDLSCMFAKEVRSSWKIVKADIPATFVSSTTVSCSMTTTPKSIEGYLVLSFIKAQNNKHLEVRSALTRSAYLPAITGGKFSANLGSVVISFANRVELKNKSATCADILPNHSSQFGTNAKCVVRGTIFVIKMLGGPTFTPGDLNVNLTQFVNKRLLQEYTVYQNNTEKVTISAPLSAEAPKIFISFPQKVGKCENLYIRTRKQKGGGRKLLYAWGAAWSSSNAGSPSGAQQTALDNINSYLQGLPTFSPKIKNVTLGDLFGVTLDINVNTTNFLNLKSNRTIQISRENIDLPSVVLDTKNVETLASRSLKLEAKVDLPACGGGSSDAQVTFLWSLLNADGSTANVELKNTGTPKFNIPAKSLSGGKTYKARVDVTMKLDPTATTSDEVEIVVKSSKLVAKVTGVQTVGSTEELKLSCKESNDPDGVTSPAPAYSWRILVSGSGKTVIKNRVAIMKALESELSKGEITIDVAKYLNSNEKYDFICVYRIGARKAQSSITVAVKAGKPPKVFTREISGPQVIGKKTRLFGRIRSQSAIIGDPEWSSENGPLGTRLGFKKRSLYVLPKDSLDEDSSYEYSLTVTNVDATATATISFKTNSKPSDGKMSVDPASGEEFKTTFSISAEETGGWSDSDGDAVTFEYGYIQDGKSVMTVLRSEETSKIYQGARLPKGTNQVYVKCCDPYNACAMAYQTVVVSAVTVDENLVNDIANTQKIQKEKQDFDGMAATGVTGLQILKDNLPSKRRRRRAIGANGKDCSSYDDNTINTQISALNEHLLTYENGKTDFDPSSRDLYVERLGTFTECGSTFLTAEYIRRSSDALTVIIGEMVARTAEEVEKDLITFDNIILPTRYDSDQQIAKSVFQTTAIKQTQRMCLGALAGEAAAIAKRSLAVLQSIKLTFSEVNNTKIGCDGCIGSMKSDYVDFSGLQAAYGSTYTCAGDKECLGACVTTIQYPTDLYASSLNESMLSSVLDINLWSPENAVSLDVTNITAGLDVHLAVTKETNNTYKCLRWDNSSSSWESNGVETTTGTSYDKNSYKYVACKLTILGPVALFEGPIQPTASSSVVASATINATASYNLSMASTVAVTTVTTTLAKKDFPRKVEFKFPFANCSSSALPNATSSVKTQIANAINISESSMTNFNLSCGSLVVTYIQIHTTNVSTEDAVALLQQLVNANNLNVTINGQVLSVDSSSLAVIVQTPAYATTTNAPTTTTTTTKAPTVIADDDGLSGGAIAGIVIGVLVFVIVVAVLVYILCFKKNSRKDNMVDPNENDVELRGKPNKGYVDSP